MQDEDVALDWAVTNEKIDEAVRRIVERFEPLRILLFGSRARGSSRPDSDVDLAVIFDKHEDALQQRQIYESLAGLDMEITLVVTTLSEYDRMKPWINSIFYNIEREGIVLYDRADQESAGRNALQAGTRRRIDVAVSAA